MEKDDKLKELLQKIEALSLQIEKYKEEVDLVKDEVSALKNDNPGTPLDPMPKKTPTEQSVPGFENFIGLKLINFVGIIVLLAGLTIGVKYVIDVDLISPFMRVILTYLAGTVLFFISLRLRKKYQLFSLILFSGSMASAYFTTYAAYEYYALLPAVPAFIVMLALTFFTVYNSIKYNRQEIAILGLTGAYGIPFFVRGNSENVTALFAYIVIINFGVLLVSFRKYWLSLMYISFFTTWLIYLSWVTLYGSAETRVKGIAFGYVFFAFFILNSLVFKTLKRLAITNNDTFLIILNSLFLYLSLILLYKESGKIAAENITLYFGAIYLFAAIAVRKYLASQRHVYNGLFGISIVALVTFTGMKYINFILTLIWVSMAVIMFVAGMLFKLKLFRIAAILLFAATLVKLLLVDSMRFNSIQKVSAYIIIGVILLIISFLYQKYKKIIFGTEKH